MLRPIFSSSHSAKWIEQRAELESNNRHIGAGYWVQTGITAHGEVWATQSEAESETVVDELDDDDVHNDKGGMRRPTVLDTSDAEAASSHGRGHRRVSRAHAALETSPCSLPPPPQATRMAPKTYWWISLWFLISIPVIFWDAGYCFMRPRSMKGGDLHWIWTPYALYQEIDYVYGLRAFENGEGFTNAQSFLNIVENLMNITYLYLAHVAGSNLATVIGFSSVVMTLSKTVLYWLQEYYCGGCSVGHNDLTTLIVYWVVPNGIWLVVPSFVIIQLGSDILSALNFATKAQTKAASGKKQ